jgi:flagellar biosynthetic protein FliR
MNGVPELVSAHAPTFLLVLCRIGGMTLLAPILGHRGLPAPHRAAFGAMLALVLTPVVGPVEESAVHHPVALVLAVAAELLVGVTIGLAAYLIMAAVQIAGEVIGLQIGFGIAASFDPSLGEQATVVTRLLDAIALLVFLSVNGHHLLLRVVTGSFERLRPGAALAFDPAVAGAITALGAKLFRSGLELAAPLVAILVVVNVVLALLARVAPQTNVFLVGLPLTVAAGVLGLIEGLPYMSQVLARLTAELTTDVGLAVGIARGAR